MGSRSGRAATRTDVARLAGVSTSVVSYVVNDGPRPVSPATRRRVLDAIEQLEYRPNPSARALKLGKTHMIGVAVTDIVNPFFAEFVNALEQSAARRGRSMILVSTHDDPEKEKVLVPELLSQGIDGVIFLCSLLNQDLYRCSSHLTRRVLLDQEFLKPGLDTIGTARGEGARMATEHLISHGHERIGYIHGELDRIPRDLRRIGWERALVAAGLPVTEPVATTWDRRGGYLATMQLLQRPVPPTAVLAGSDLMAIGVLQAAHELGRSVPEDVAIVSFDGTAESAYSWPPLTSIRQPFELMADCAVDMITGKRREPGHHEFPMEMVVRSSCGCHAAG